jgi:uncharacterized protein with GYD domain
MGFPLSQEVTGMAHFLFQCSYTPEAWASQLKNPQNRIEAVGPVLEKLGGRFVEAFLAFGEYDVVAICETPDNVSQSAFALAAYATGHLSSIKTTPLLTIEEGIEAMGKAGSIAYPAPAE